MSISCGWKQKVELTTSQRGLHSTSHAGPCQQISSKIQSVPLLRQILSRFKKLDQIMDGTLSSMIKMQEQIALSLNTELHKLEPKLITMLTFQKQLMFTKQGKSQKTVAILRQQTTS